MAEAWDKKLRYRGFRLLAWSLPTLILSLLVTSLIPRRPPLLLASGKVTQVQPSSGRLALPERMDGPIPVLLELQWSQRPPRDLLIELLIQDPGDQERLQKKIPARPKAVAGRVLQQTLNFALTTSPVQNYRLSLVGTAPGAAVSTQYRLIAFAAMPWTKLLRIAEMLIYPALAFAILAVCMIVFPKFMS